MDARLARPTEAAPDGASAARLAGRYALVVVATALVSLALVRLLTDDDATVLEGAAALRQLAWMTLVAGGGLMAPAFRAGFRGGWDTAAVTGCSAWTFVAFVQPDPRAWMVLPAFLLPWLLLLVELPARHRLLLLGMQWVASALTIETLTNGPAATTALGALGILHVALVWVTLPPGPARWVPLGVLMAMGAILGATALVFLLQDPTARRIGVLALAAALVAVPWRVGHDPRASQVRLPPILRAPTSV